MSAFNTKETVEYVTGQYINSPAAKHMCGDDLDLLVPLFTDPKLYMEELLFIQDKNGQLTRFQLNWAQNRVLAELQRQEKLGIPARVVILKARQLGITTFFSGLGFRKAANNKNTEVGIISHKNDASRKVLEKVKLFYENLPPLLQPMQKNSNANELIFDNPAPSARQKILNPGLHSRIAIETAVNKNAFRGSTLQFLHLSELAFWPYPEETMTSALQAVPQNAGTVVAVESTANGIGNYFHRLWQSAERGESEFVPLFFPWHAEPTYRLPVPPGFQRSEEEEELAQEFGLTDEQICWRRWCLRANCNGDINKFHQEYPATPHEAFIASGRPVFDIQILEQHLKECASPVAMGRVVERNGEPHFQTVYNGFLSIWEYPKAGREYTIGIDTAQGLENGDYSVMMVFDLRTHCQVAEWHGHIDADLLGTEAALLGRFYNDAWLVPEINNTGIATLAALRRARYGRIYRRRTTAEALSDAPKDNYGWYTSGKTKPLLIDNFAAFIRDNVGKIRSRQLVMECQSYVYDASGRTNAQEGCYDDRVMAAALGTWLFTERLPREMDNFSAIDINQLYGGLNSTTGY